MSCSTPAATGHAHQPPARDRSRCSRLGLRTQQHRLEFLGGGGPAIGFDIRQQGIGVACLLVERGGSFAEDPSETTPHLHQLRGGRGRTPRLHAATIAPLCSRITDRPLCCPNRYASTPLLFGNGVPVSRVPSTNTCSSGDCMT